MINLTIDGKTLSVPKGTTVYKAAQQLGIDVPVFCYQDRMPPFGACRMCLVEIEKMPKLQTSCTLEATDGMVVKTQSEMALKGREGIVEFLLINHPLDCPICDRGGECPLQEHALHHGPGKSRFFEEKRHFKKPIPLGPVLMLDRERCIVCARCTRFGDLMAGDHALEFIDRGYRTEVGTPDGGPAESKFIGNTIMICPVGALTSQVYRFRARPWDNDSTPSTCTLCPVGCSLNLDSRDGEIMRTRSRENKEVNDIWLCDKGWFGYEFSYHEKRLNTPLIRRQGKLEKASWNEALSLISSKIQDFKLKGKLAAWGGNPLTVEENYLLQKLMRDGAGVNHVDHRVGMPLHSLADEGMAPGMELSLGECEDLSFAVLFGLDLTEEFPLLWLRLRQAINKGAKVLFLGHYAPEIDSYCKNVILHAPGEELEILRQHLPHIASLSDNGKGALFVGSQYLNHPYRSQLLSEMQKLCQTKQNLSLNIMEGRGNSCGARFAGMRPDLAPQGAPVSVPGLNCVEVLNEASDKGWDLLYVVGANPAVKYPSKLWNQARKNLQFLVVQDLFLTETAAQADLVLPALSFVEKGGSFINIEGRVQTLLPGKEIPENLYSDAEIFNLIAQQLKLDLNFDSQFEESLKPKTKIRLAHAERIFPKAMQPIEKESQSLLATFTYTLFDHGVRMKHNPHVIELVKEPRVRVHPLEAIKRNLKEGDQVKLVVKENQISAKIVCDEKVASGTIVLPLGFPELAVHELSPQLVNGLIVELRA